MPRVRVPRDWLPAVPLIAVVAAYAGACLLDAQQYDLRGQDVRLTILHTSDMHSRLLPYKYVPLSSDADLGLDPAKGPFGGIARVAYILNHERKKADRVLYVDTGDVFQGAPIFNMYKGEVEFRAMSQLHPDSMVVGNHEFDLGVTNLQDQYQAWGGFPLLAANYVVDTGPTQKSKLFDFLVPTQIVDVKGLRVGIIGLGDITSMYSLGEGGNSLGITPLDLWQTLTTYIQQIKPLCDLVVVASHLGLTEDTYAVNGYYTWLPRDQVPDTVDSKGRRVYTILADDKTAIDTYSRDVPLSEESDWGVLESPAGWVKVRVSGVEEIDLILGGHLHIVTDPPKVLKDVNGRDVIISHDGAFAKFVGRLDLVVHVPKDAGDVRGIRGLSHRIFPVDSTVPDDGQMTNLLSPYVINMNDQMNLGKPIAFALQKVRRYSGGGTDSEVGPPGGDSQIGNLVSDAMRIRKRVEAEFALTNSLGIRTDFEAGVLDVETMYNVFPFENTLTTMFLSGQEVQDLLDYASYRSAGRGCQSQVQVSGVSFLMNCATGKAENVTIGGSGAQCTTGADCTGGEVCSGDLKCRRKLNLAASYKLATNDYIAGGGSGFLVLKRNTTKFNTGISLRDTLADYLQTLPACAPPEWLQRCCGDDWKSVPECQQVDTFDAKNFGGDSTTAMSLLTQYRDTGCVKGPMPCLTPKNAREEGRILIRTTK